MIRLESGISGTNTTLDNINHLKKKRRLLYFKTSSYRAVNTFISVMKTKPLCCMRQKFLFVPR